MNPFSFSSSLMKTDMLGENKGDPAAASCWHMHQQLPVTLRAGRDTPEHPAAISPRQPSPVSRRAPAQKVRLGVCREWGTHNMGQASMGVPVPRFCVQAFILSVKCLAINHDPAWPFEPPCCQGPTIPVGSTSFSLTMFSHQLAHECLSLKPGQQCQPRSPLQS